MADDVVEKRAQDLALHVERQNREETVAFYKNLAAMDQHPVPPALLKYDSKDISTQNAQALLNEKIRALKSGMLRAEPSRFSLAMFLLDRLSKIKQAVSRENKTGLFSLYVSLREQLGQMLSESYYDLDERAAMEEYLAIEPLVCALSDLCGLSMPTIDEIAKSYGV
jgi:hypothetical protein